MMDHSDLELLEIIDNLTVRDYSRAEVNKARK